MRVDLHSRRLLVAWSAYCCVHAATGGAHPLLLRYGVALDYQDLRHLTLSDRPAVDAMLGVAAYLQACLAGVNKYVGRWSCLCQPTAAAPVSC